jgi:3,4-dihydroxy 2-butanone 4-phosphate synthase
MKKTARKSVQADLLQRSGFGSAQRRVEKAVRNIKSGKGVIVVDDEKRENEGDLIFAAEKISKRNMAQLIRDCSGIVCLVLDDKTCRKLRLPPMAKKNTSRYGTAFTVSIEARRGVSTGVSASDRVTTVRTAIAPGCKPQDLASPGHVFPLRAHPKGLSGRSGHTEATMELVRRAGLRPAGVLCEVTNPDGTMARLPQLIKYAKKNRLPIVTIDDLMEFEG